MALHLSQSLKRQALCCIVLLRRWHCMDCNMQRPTLNVTELILISNCWKDMTLECSSDLLWTLHLINFACLYNFTYSESHLYVLLSSLIVCIYEPRQANLVLIAYASSEGSGDPAHPRSLARTFAARSYKQWVKRNLQTESQIPGLSEWLCMRS